MHNNSQALYSTRTNFRSIAIYLFIHIITVLTLQLDKLPINDISIASTREIESLIAEARSAGLVADEKVAAEELQVLHRKANQYLTTIVGLPKVYIDRWCLYLDVYMNDCQTN